MSVSSLGDYDPAAMRLKGKGGDKYNTAHSKGATVKVAVTRTVSAPALKTKVVTKPSVVPIEKPEKALVATKLAMKENKPNMPVAKIAGLNSTFFLLLFFFLIVFFLLQIS